MINPKVTKKEQGLLKGAIRRVFARSELRNAVLEAGSVKHSDPKRPRVKKWVTCAECKKPSPKWSSAVDHKDPVVALTSSFEEQGLDGTIDRMWCDASNLQILCESCHSQKSKAEAKERAANKKSKKK